MSRPADASPEPCWFEPLGLWRRCSESWSGAPGAEKIPTLAECSRRCREDASCASIVDYTWIDPSIGCFVWTGACTPSTDVGYGEDAGREYRKACGPRPPEGAVFELEDSPGLVIHPSSGCRFVSIGDGLRCENSLPYSEATVTGKTLDECLGQCERRNDCSAVEDYWSGASAYECVLHLSTCDAPQATSSMSRFYRKVCGLDG